MRYKNLCSYKNLYSNGYLSLIYNYQHMKPCERPHGEGKITKCPTATWWEYSVMKGNGERWPAAAGQTPNALCLSERQFFKVLYIPWAHLYNIRERQHLKNGCHTNDCQGLGLAESWATRRQVQLWAVMELSYIFVVAVIILITVLLKTHKNHTLFTSKLYCVYKLCCVLESPWKRPKGWHCGWGNCNKFLVYSKYNLIQQINSLCTCVRNQSS